MKPIRTLVKTSLHFCQSYPWTWLTAWTAWFITLWVLSSGTPTPQNLPQIPHLDKIAHFGFFLGGAGLFSAWLHHTFPKLTLSRCFWITTCVGAIVGIIDEYHQSFTPGRHGNDLGDWVADLLGSMAGALIMLSILNFHKKRTSPPPNSIETT